MMQGHFTVLSLLFKMFCVPKCTSMPYIYLKPKEKMLSYSMNNRIVDKEIN